MRSDHQQRVMQFMLKAGQDVPTTIIIPDEQTRLLRATLTMSEALEKIRAMGVDVNVSYPGVSRDHLPVTDNHLRFSINHERGVDLIELADGCADLSVVNQGDLIAFGIHDVELLEEVDRSNMDKFRGDAHRALNGKWIKPSDWQPPDIVGVLHRQIQSQEDCGVIDPSIEGYL